MIISIGRPASVRRSMAFTAVCMTVIGFAAACSTDAATGPEPVLNEPSLAVLQSDVVTSVRSRLSQAKCLTVESSSASTIAKGDRVDLEPCDGRSTQQFNVQTTGRITIGNDFCLDAANATGKDGDSVIVWNCHGGPNQLWDLTDAGEIRGVSGKCVDVADANARDGQPIILWSCHGGSNQKWDLDATSSPSPTPAPVASVAVAVSETSLMVGQTAQATATLQDAGGNVLSGRAVSWASTAPAVASVTAAGLVTALSAGSATIVAMSEGQSASSAALTVTAPETAPPEGGACTLVTGLARYPVSPLAKPGYLASVTEPEFGTRLTRVSGDPGAAIANVGGTWPTTVYGNYPKDPVWNADQSLLLLKHAGGWLFLDGASYQPLFRRSPPGTELRWHPTQPDVMVYVESNGSVGHWNVRTQSRTVRFAASGYSGARMGPNEGNLSRDGRWVVVNATRASDGRAVAYAVDVDAGAKGADLDLATQGVSNLDWAGISATGAYIVVHGVINGTSITTKVFSRATLALVSHWPEISRPAHFDLTVDAAGNEVAVGAAGGGVDSKYFIMRRLDNGAVTRLGPTGWNAHASARALGRPGWAYVVTNDATGSALDGEMVGLKLDGSGTVERYGRFRSATTDYEAYPMPVPSPDGKRILFASNWQVSGGRPVQAYVLDVCR